MTTLPPAIYERLKQSTVAIALMKPDKSGAPFTILGSGFCVDSRGIVVTCRHVQEAVVHPESLRRLKEGIESKEARQFDDLQAYQPHALFYHPEVRDGNLAVFPVPVEAVVVFTDYDLALMRLKRHTAFSKGYPFLEVLEYSEVQETMPVGICGFPLGNYLYEQLGTVGSSFTAGTLSSISPIRGVPKEHVKAFQLNAAATYGNSGGPVFSPSNGKVFGVLQGGVAQHNGDIYQGLTRAEPVYQVFRNGGMDRVMTIRHPDDKTKPKQRMKKPKTRSRLGTRP